MIIGIEGTGSQGWDNTDLRRTFVRRIIHQSKLRPASYFIGPNNEGSDGATIMDAAFQALKNGAHNKPVVLVGYSRGAAYCMEIAKRFAPFGKIDVLIMFDAVARQADVDIPDKVPGNVVKCYHAYRDPRGGSRYFFSNVGLYPANPGATNFHKAMFFGSHGAIGGCSYDAKNDEGSMVSISYNANSMDSNKIGESVMTVDDRDKLNIPRQPTLNKHQDDAAAAKVADWMWPFLIANGIVPSNADPHGLAPAFSGSRVAGDRNMIK